MQLFFCECDDQFPRIWMLSTRTRQCNKTFIFIYCDFRKTAESQPRCEETTLYCQECDKTFSNAVI